MKHVDTYYTPVGDEYANASTNPAAEKVVAARLKAGDHVHVWTLAKGLECPAGTCPTDPAPSQSLAN